MTENALLIDKCTQCDTWFVVGSAADLQRRLAAHELDAHGCTEPTLPDHRTMDDA